MAYDNEMPPAGWYPDPEGGPGQRYWTGTSWAAPTLPDPSSIYPAQTVPTHPVAVAPSPVAAIPAEPQRDVRPGRAVGPFGLPRTAWIVGGVVLVALVLAGAYFISRPGTSSPTEGTQHHTVPAPGTPGGPPKPGLSTYTAMATKTGVLAPYAIGFNLTVTNTGSTAARPTCVVTASSASNPDIASSTYYPASIEPGKTATTMENITIPKSGAKHVTSLSAKCT
jgi:Protein of unknown function (DUF2510)